MKNENLKARIRTWKPGLVGALLTRALGLSLSLFACAWQHSEEDRVTESALSTPAYAQGHTASADAFSATIAAAFPNANTAGNLIVVSASWGGTNLADVSTTMSDSHGNSYHLATRQWDPTYHQGLGIWYAANVQAGSNTVTLTFSPQSTYRRIAVHEYSGVGATVAVDVTASNFSTGATPTSTAATTTQDGDLVFGAVSTTGSGTVKIAPGSGYALRDAISILGSEDRAQASAGAVSAAFSLDSSTQYLCQLVAFKVGGGASTSCGYGGFGPGHWPPACFRPYASNSVWNSRIPANPRLYGNSAGIVANVTSIGQPFVTQFTYTAPYAAPSTHDISHPTYYATSADPIYTIDNSLSCANRTNTTSGMKLRIPTAARPAGGSDGHLTIIDQSTNQEWDFYDFPRGGVSGGGTLVGPTGCGVDNVLTGTGRVSHTTVAHFDNWAGMIRGEELAAGGPNGINHALFLVAGCVDGSGGVYPSIHAAGGFHQCSQAGGSNVNAPPAGALFWLDYSDAEIEALNIPVWEKTLAYAFAHHGGYIGDTGGGTSPNMGFRFEGATTYSVYGQTSPVVKVAQAAGIPFSSGNSAYQFNPTGIDWAHHLHVVDPCVALGLTGQPGGCVSP